MITCRRHRTAQFICSHYFDKMSFDERIHVLWTMSLGTSVVLDWIPEWFLCCQTRRKPCPARHDRRYRCRFTVDSDQVIKLLFCSEQTSSCCFLPVFKIATCYLWILIICLFCFAGIFCAYKTFSWNHIVQGFESRAHPMSYAKCGFMLLNLGPTCGKGMSRCVGMPWNAFLAYSGHEKVVKTAPTHSLSPATTVCPIGYANVMLASLFDPLKTNQVLLGYFANGLLGHSWEKSYSKSFGKRAYL